ncbi:MAG: peptidyl-prolyl cis-trans isomerase [Terriglobales bacterium]
MPASRSLACAVALLVATFALGACGGSASRHDAEASGSLAPASAEPVAEPNAVVVRVGGHAITRAMLAHSLAGAVRFSEDPNSPPPVPPDFTACVKHLKAAAAPSAPSSSKPSVAELKSKCRQQYRRLQKPALDPLISNQWVIGGAAEEGVHVSEQELQQQLKKAEAGKSQAQVARELAISGRTVADFVLETKVQLLGEGIRHVLMRKTEHVTRAQLASYYNEHKSLYGTPKRRDLEIARLGSQAQAQKVKREIASGKTFASVVSKLPLPQPIYSRDGLVSGYEPHAYSQAPLDHAIFAAKPNTLSGPVHISLGYYVFEVKRVIPPVQRTLAQVQASIRPQLPMILYKQALLEFVKAWRERWRARTDCQAGYVVAKCRQSRASGAGALEKEDPYTLD